LTFWGALDEDLLLFIAGNLVDDVICLLEVGLFYLAYFFFIFNL